MSVNVYLAIPVLLILLILQVTVAPLMEIYGVAPQMLFLLTLAWSLYFGWQQGIVLAFIAGILVDLFSAGPMGISSLAMIAAVSVSVGLQRLLPRNRILVPLALGAAAFMVFWLVQLLLLRMIVPLMIDSIEFLSSASLASGSRSQLLMDEISSGYGLANPVGELALRSILLHSILIVPVYWLLSVLDRIIRPRQVEI